MDHDAGRAAEGPKLDAADPAPAAHGRVAARVRAKAARVKAKAAKGEDREVPDPPRTLSGLGRRPRLRHR
jgi:hypothetical protein